jgi:hypothetical protein
MGGEKGRGCTEERQEAWTSQYKYTTKWDEWCKEIKEGGIRDTPRECEAGGIQAAEWQLGR